MRTSISFGGAGGAGDDWQQVVDYVREAERLGVHFAWSAEAWGQDAVTTVAYLAAVTSRIRLGTGIMQISARAPAMTAMTARPELPIYLATLGPGSLELTGERAHGWLGTSFVPDRADVFLEPLARGATRAGRTLSDLDVQAGGRLRITDDVSGTVAKLKPVLAFMLGAMGSATHNCYNDAYRRAGWEEAAREVQRLWLERRREEAVAAVPDDLVLRSSLIGSPDMVRERIRCYRDAGVTTLRLSPIGDTLSERVEQLGQALDLIGDSQSDRACR